MAKYFKISMSLRKQENGDAIYYKQDGERFGSPHTVKLNVNTEYDVHIEIRPPVTLHDVLIHGERLEPKLDEKKTKDDETVYAYNLTFNTINYDLNNRGKRKEIPFVFELEKGLTLSVKLQCKLYKEHETEHCKWGQALTTLEYECHVPENQTYVDVIREKFL